MDTIGARGTFPCANGKVHQQNRVFGYEAHQHHDADHREHGQGGTEHQKRQNDTDQSQRQCCHQSERLQKAFELAGQNHVDEYDGQHKG